ncbi:hypothetical protein R3P38DRAFT_2389080, partial [Favolaschia claudopus]
RPGRTTTDAVLLLVQRIKDAWRRKHIASALLLDISQLIHNLRRRGLPEQLVNWVVSFLTDRETTLQFDDFVS